MNRLFTYSNDLIAGLLSGIVLVIISTAFTALIFKGALAIYFSIGISCTLIGSFFINLITTRYSSFPFAIARPEPAVAAILAVIFANIASNSLQPDALLPTLLMTIFIVSTLVGIIMFLLGYFHLGQIARFLPYPVLGGIITGLAWMMAKASFALISDSQITTAISFLPQKITALLFAFFLFFLPKKNENLWLMPFSIFISMMVLGLFFLWQGISHQQAIHSGWLFSSFEPTFIWSSLHVDWARVDWWVILHQAGFLASLFGVMIILLLLNVSGLETLVNLKADLEKELKVAGIANSVGGLFIGMPSAVSFTGTLLNENIGAKNRVSGVVASLVCLMVLFVCPDVVSFLPKPIIAGLLLFMAFNLFYEWLYEGYKKLPSIDYVIVWAILLTIIFWGFLTGMVVGILITCMVFIFCYSRIDVIQFSTTGEYYRSTVIRAAQQQSWLSEKGKVLQIFKLQGYLFFGSAKSLYDKISALIEKSNGAGFQFIIFDFQAITGIDSSASFSFIKLKQLAAGAHLQIIFSQCSARLTQQFKLQGVLSDQFAHIMMFPDLDQGVEWCENQLLKRMPKEKQPELYTIHEILGQFIPEENSKALFLQSLEKVSVPAFHYLFKQKDKADCLYFIEQGEIAIFLEGEDSVIRLSKSGPGTIVGEIAFYLDITRSATVRAETPCIVYKLTRSALNQLEFTYPAIAIIFHKKMIEVLSNRLIQTNYELQLRTNVNGSVT